MAIVRDSFKKNKRGDILDRLPITQMPKGILLIGQLERIRCETPKVRTEYDWPRGKNVDGEDILVNSSNKRPLVCASDKGNMVMIVSPDAVDLTNNYDAQGFLDDAIDLHTDFHGVEPPEIKKVDVSPFEKVLFFGWLNDIVYSVPEYSERRGLPFIHKAKDKGDGVAPSKEKPFICVTPAHDMLLIYGPELTFNSRGIIG